MLFKILHNRGESMMILRPLSRRNIRLKRIGKSLTPTYFSTTGYSRHAKHFGNLLRGGENSLLDEQRQQIQKDLISVKGSLAIEGLRLTKKEEQLVILNALGQISDEEFDRKVMELINNE